MPLLAQNLLRHKCAAFTLAKRAPLINPLGFSGSQSENRPFQTELGDQGHVAQACRHKQACPGSLQNTWCSKLFTMKPCRAHPTTHWPRPESGSGERGVLHLGQGFINSRRGHHRKLWVPGNALIC